MRGTSSRISDMQPHPEGGYYRRDVSRRSFNGDLLSVWRRGIVPTGTACMAVWKSGITMRAGRWPSRSRRTAMMPKSHRLGPNLLCWPVKSRRLSVPAGWWQTAESLGRLDACWAVRWRRALILPISRSPRPTGGLCPGQRAVNLPRGLQLRSIQSDVALRLAEFITLQVVHTPVGRAFLPYPRPAPIQQPFWH